MSRTAEERQDKIDGLTERYRLGEISETVYFVSLSFFMTPADAKVLVNENQVFFRNSLPYKRGFVT